MQELSAQDIGETLEDVLDTVGKNKKKLIIEKEELDDLKEEMKDYQEVRTKLITYTNLIIHDGVWESTRLVSAYYQHLKYERFDSFF